MKLFLVGGAVRDMQAARTSKDWDFAVDPEGASFAEIQAELEAEGWEVFASNPQHMSLRARAPEGFTFAGMTPPVRTFDFTLTRKDVSTDGRHAITAIGTIEDDLARRDFTINAMAMDSSGGIIDPHHGADDLRAGILRTVGDAETRFAEDGLRVIRGVRFMVTRDLFPAAATDEAMASIGLEMLTRDVVSRDVIREELNKALRHDTVATLRILAELNLLSLFDETEVWLQATTKPR